MKISIRYSKPAESTSLEIRAVTPEIVGDFPDLEGSEKQTAWAGDIRTNAARHLGEWLAEKAIGHRALLTSADPVEEDEAKFDAWMSDEGKQFEEGLRVLFGITESRWWIDQGKANNPRPWAIAISDLLKARG